MIDRRQSLAWLGAIWAFGGASLAEAVTSRNASGAGQDFSWDLLKADAKRIATAPPRPLPKPDPAAHAVDYDAANRIAFRAERAIGPDDGYSVRLFPLIRTAPFPVQIWVVDKRQARRIEHSRDMFEAVPGQGPAPHILDGVAGLRVVNKGGVGDWLAFLGASYFRSAGALDQYGLSARGLAIDTGIDGREEFPSFTSFWIERAAGGALTIYALLEGPSVVGAYRFTNMKRGEIVQDVSVSLWFRKDVERLGIAPLTSMFWYDEGSRPQAIDWRPEIHDSDCLLMVNGAGERISRPLGNPLHPTINSFEDKAPKGFGLLQRDRKFDHYQDDGVYYDKRPSLWVEPKGDWGAGAVMLYEIPTTKEYEDNIVAFWSPKGPVKAGAALNFDYRLRWMGGEPDASPLARAVDRWTGIAGRPGTDPIPNARRLVIDFEGPALKGLGRDAGVSAVVSVDQGKTISVDAYPVVGAQARWRLIVDMTKVNAPTNVRATLERHDRPISETVIHQFY
jgi:glucans biosynthesis protein